MRDPNPTVILIPGLGMIAWGKDKSESRVTAEFYNCAVEVMRGAEAIDEYTALPLQEAFDIEYWLLEEAKLQRMPPEKELARQVIAVVGAGSGIGTRGRAAAGEGRRAHRLRRRDEAAARGHRQGDHRHARRRHRRGRQRHLELRPGDRARVPTSPSAPASARCWSRWRWPMAALDAVAVTAGIFVAPDTTGRIPDEQWALHLRDQRDRAAIWWPTRRRRSGRRRGCRPTWC